jgi:hypothetical protein
MRLAVVRGVLGEAERQHRYLHWPGRHSQYHVHRRPALPDCSRPGKSGQASTRGAKELPNKRMKLTKLSAAWLPEWTCRLMPAPAGSYAGTASQLMRGVRPTWGGKCVTRLA